MAEQPVSMDFDNIPYRRLFPWLHLIRAFWIAADIRKLVLAAAALLLVSVGSVVCDRLPFATAPDGSAYVEDDSVRWPWQSSLGYSAPPSATSMPPLQTLIHSPRETMGRALTNWQVVLLPVRDMVGRAPVLFDAGASRSQIADAATRLLWNLIVWSVFGGAICRIAAVQFARDQHIGLWPALKFSLLKFFSYFSAPLLPLVAVALLWALCVIGGWIGQISAGGVGPGILGVLWGLELLFGFLMMVVLIGVAAGWPLMFATISVEGTDGFDGLSRAYNYVFERPLYSLWQAVVAMCFGSLTIFFVWILGQVVTQLAMWGVSWGQGYAATAELVAGGPEIVVGAELARSAPTPTFGAEVARGWLCGLTVLVVGYVYTYFWSASTIMYFVLRRSVDANDFDEVYLEDVVEVDDLLPLVGTAGMGEVPGPPPAVTAPPAAGPADKPVDLTP